MVNRISSSLLKQITCILGMIILVTILSAGLFTGLVAASPLPPETSSAVSFNKVSLQNTEPTTTTNVAGTNIFSFSLETLGYDENILLRSPYDYVQYSFSIPDNWEIKSDGQLNLHLSYNYSQISPTDVPALLGTLIVMLDGEPLRTLEIDESIDDFQVNIPIPSSLLNNPDRSRHNLALEFNASYLCEIPHKATMIIYPSSTISLDYEERPIEIALERYPRPFYQAGFEPDTVKFVIPAQPTNDDATNAMAVAAKLGDLTGNQMVISATTDLELENQLSGGTIPVDDSLIIIGTPENNQLISYLDENFSLPVSLHQRELGLAATGAGTIVAGTQVSYKLAVTNTTAQDKNISIVNPLPIYTSFSTCEPDCQIDGNVITWPDQTIAPAETLNLELIVQLSEAISQTTIDNTTTLLDADSVPLNANTLVSTVVTNTEITDTPSQTSRTEDTGVFFTYNGLGVAADDGIIQEILSPWNDKKAILILTGLNENAVKKASTAMSSRTTLPGMTGSVALVKDIDTAKLVNKTDLQDVKIELTFADMGYSDQTIYGGGQVIEVDYWFDVPYGWELTSESRLDLYFSHSQLIDYANSGLSVLINRQPVGSVAFTEETAANGYLSLNLGDAQIFDGQRNRLTLEVEADIPGICTDNDRAWVLIKNKSTISLNHRINSNLRLDFDSYPYPFYQKPALSNLFFVLPDTAAIHEWETGLRLAAALGNSAGGNTILPRGGMASNLSATDLADYHLVVIGRPTRNTLLQEINANLPQPFIAGTDAIEQKLDDIIFRLDTSRNLGYLQLLPSPWNKKQALLAITGTSDEGIRWGEDILTRRVWSLGRGDLALLTQDTTDTIDTRELRQIGIAAAMATAVPVTSTLETTEADPTKTPTPIVAGTLQDGDGTQVEIEGTNNTVEYPTWLIPLVGGTGLVVIVILAVAFRQSRRRTIS